MADNGLFGGVFSFLASWFDKGLRLVQQAQAFGLWVWSCIVGVLVSVISTATYMMNHINALLLYLVGYLDSLRMSSDIVGGVQASTMSFMSMLEMANTLFPVSELFSIMVTIAALQGACSVYGLIKSWIPTVSS